MARDNHSKGIGNRSVTGSGATWAGRDEVAPRPQSKGSTHGAPSDSSGGASRRELRPRDERAPPGPARASAGSDLTDQITGLLGQIGDLLLGVGRFILRKVIAPTKAAIFDKWKVIRARAGMEDRLVDGDTFDPDRARDWERFKKGKRSSSYLQDDVDKE